MNFTPSQQQGMLDYKKFMLNPAENTMNLIGAAGMGKTYLTGHFLNELKNLNQQGAYLGNHEIKEVALTATTNKAAGVLANMSYKNAEVSTLASFLGLILKRDYSTGKEKLVARKNGPVEHWNKLVIIDEASYLDSQYKYYMDKALHNCKILLSGDNRQLKSVSEPMYDPFTAWGQITSSELQENMRFDPKSPLGLLNAQLREWVVNQNQRMTITPNGQDIIFADHNNIKIYLDAAFVHNTMGDTRVICYKNKTCMNYNEYALQSLGYTKPYHRGMKLVVNTAYAPQGHSNRLHVDRELTVEGVDETQVDVLGVPCWKIFTNRGYYHMPLNPQGYRDYLTECAKTRAWQLYFDLKDNIVDARPDYARTSHKAQGSSHDTVIIDMHDLMDMANTSLDMFIRAMYVAVSRARQRVIIYGYPTN